MPKDPQLKKYLEHLSLGTEIAVTIGGPILIGYWLDTVYDSTPRFTLIGVLIGLVMLVVTFIRLIKKYNQ